MERGEFAATLCVPEIRPVGGLVVDAGTSWFVDEDLKQQGTTGIAGAPIIREASADQGKDSGSQIFAANPRQDQDQPCRRQ